MRSHSEVLSRREFGRGRLFNPVKTPLEEDRAPAHYLENSQIELSPWTNCQFAGSIEDRETCQIRPRGCEQKGTDSAAPQVQVCKEGVALKLWITSYLGGGVVIWMRPS